MKDGKGINTYCINYLQDYLNDYFSKEIIYTDFKAWKKVFTHIMELKKTEGVDNINKAIMSEEDYFAFQSMPDKLAIYRGGVDDTGISWTLSRSKAKWFQDRFKGMKDSRFAYLMNRETENLKLFHKVIPKEDAVLYYNGRSEQEIIYIGELNENN